MDSRWFQEDREDAKRDPSITLDQRKAESEQSLRNSTLIRRRLIKILEAEVEKINREAEDFTKPNWEREIVANVARRKTLREIIELIDFK